MPNPEQPLAETPARRRFWTARRAWILIAGTTVVLTGLVISPLPGPGFSILGPLGFGILATEFAWARHAMARVNRQEKALRVYTDRVAVHIPRWFIVPVVVVYWLAIWALAEHGPIKPIIVWALSYPVFLPVAYVSLRIAKMRAKRKAERHAALISAAGTTTSVTPD